MFALVALTSSFFGRLDVHAVAPGKVETAGYSKVIEPLDPGKVAAIHVDEGASAGGPLLSRFRGRLLERIEGIVRESVRPMEKIEAIKILHIDGANGANGHRNVTDEVIDSALRYRVQAPMIDSLMKEIGIEGGGLGRMTEVLRDAKDIEALKQKRARDEKAIPRPTDDREDDRR